MDFTDLDMQFAGIDSCVNRVSDIHLKFGTYVASPTGYVPVSPQLMLKIRKVFREMMRSMIDYLHTIIGYMVVLRAR